MIVTPNKKQIQRAHQLYRSDWDAFGTVDFSLPQTVALELLTELGYEYVGQAPDGYWKDVCGEVYWTTSAALMTALTASVS